MSYIVTIGVYSSDASTSQRVASVQVVCQAIIVLIYISFYVRLLWGPMSRACCKSKAKQKTRTKAKLNNVNEEAIPETFQGITAVINK